MPSIRVRRRPTHMLAAAIICATSASLHAQPAPESVPAAESESGSESGSGSESESESGSESGSGSGSESVPGSESESESVPGSGSGSGSESGSGSGSGSVPGSESESESAARRPQAQDMELAPIAEKQAPRAPRRHGLSDFGLGLELGGSFGGEKIISASFEGGGDDAIFAGAGYIVGAALRWTPIHLGAPKSQWMHLGLGTDIGFRFYRISASNAGVMLTVFPWTLTAHTHVRLEEDFHLLVAAGAQLDMGAHVSTEGALMGSADLGTELGAVADLGIHYESDHPDSTTGIDVRLRYVAMEYFGPDLREPVDASSIGIRLGVYYMF